MTTQNANLEELDRRLGEKWISGIWRIPAGARPGDPKTKIQPHLWKWADIYDGLMQARDQINVERGQAERRTLRFVNPGAQDNEMTSHTMLFAFQTYSTRRSGATPSPHHVGDPLYTPGERSLYERRRSKR